jgi:hypothetical protein
VTEARAFKAEIEEVLVDRSGTRFAKVLAGMKRGLTEAEMAQEASPLVSRSAPTASPRCAESSALF